MNTKKLLELFKVEDLRFLPEAIMSVLEGDVGARNEVYRTLLEWNNYDLSYDWFASIYESEMSQRKENKQDFTPRSLAKLCSLLTGPKEGTVYEPTAGNGSMLIADWLERCRRLLPWEHFPSKNMFYCHELSSRAIPFLLLNLSIRGMMGYVYHGDVLTGEIKAKYILLNRKDNTLAFSDVIKDVNHCMTIKEVTK